MFCQKITIIISRVEMFRETKRQYTIYATVPNCSDLIQIPNTASAGQMEVTRLDLDVCGEC